MAVGSLIMERRMMPRVELEVLEEVGLTIARFTLV